MYSSVESFFVTINIISSRNEGLTMKDNTECIRIVYILPEKIKKQKKASSPYLKFTFELQRPHP